MLSKQVVTMANCIVGVSVLAMPFCFKQCGVVLASIILLVSGIMTRTVCMFLLKASTITRRRTYELLAYHTFGQGGKLAVEISIIGFLVGTLIAFLVVMGDLGPEILSDIFAVENNSSLRCIIMTALSLFVALPLGLLRNIDSLSGVSTASMLFYVFLVCKIFSEGMGPLWSGSFLTRIDYWRPAGVLQCIPIFSMALSCQTQIFGIYDSLPDPSLHKMNEIVKKAINLCTLFYISVGFLGYIAFCTQPFGGNILLSFGPTWSTQLIKICFVLSIAFSFPLVIFPCRASLHSLIFKRVHNLHHHISTDHIPESRLKVLTVGIILFTLIVGLLIPNIELVLGLVGSTTGAVICIIFPAAMFTRVTSKNTTERLLAQFLVFMGILIMIVTTYVTLYAVEQAQVNEPLILREAVGNTESIRMMLKEERMKKGDPNIKIPNLDEELLRKNSGKDFDVKFANSVVRTGGSADSGSNNDGVVKKAKFEKLVESKQNSTYLKSTSNIPQKVSIKTPVPFEKQEAVADQNQNIVNVQANPPQQQQAEPIIKNEGVGKISAPDIPDKLLRRNVEDPKSIKVDEGPPSMDNEVLKKVPKIKTKEAANELDAKIRKEIIRSLDSNPIRMVPSEIKTVNKTEKEPIKSLPPVAAVQPGLNNEDQQQVLTKNMSQKSISPSPSSASLNLDSKINAEEFLLQLKKHELEQKKLLQEQKEILEKLKEHQAVDEKKKQQAESEIKQQKQVEDKNQQNQVEDVKQQNQVEDAKQQNQVEDAKQQKLDEELKQQKLQEELQRKKLQEELQRQKLQEEIKQKKAVEEAKLKKPEEDIKQQLR